MDSFDRKIHSQLLTYLKSTLLSSKNPTILSSTRALLEAKYNTTKHASKLYNHYKSKPKLRAYTLEKELPRMEYVVHVNDGGERKLTNPKDIQNYFSHRKDNQDEIEDIIIRASNQSILADVMSALTGDDKLIRPMPFMVTGVASHCHFNIDLRKNKKDAMRGVTALSTLLVSMPSGTTCTAGRKGGNRLNIAKIHVRIQFYPSSKKSSKVEHKICSVEPLLHLPRDDYFICRASKSLSRDLKKARPLKLPSAKIVPEVNQNPKYQEYQESPVMFLCSKAKHHFDSIRAQELDGPKALNTTLKAEEGKFHFRIGQVQSRLRPKSARSA